jgi:hypothetical protein
MPLLLHKVIDSLQSKMVQLTWFFAGTVAILYLLYRYILPRPIPGIPYNHEAVRTPLGDVPTMSKHVNETQEIWSFMTKQNIKHKSPIVQVFVRPDSTHFRLGPWVSLCDARESYDILVRRTREFDRSPVLANFLRLVARTQHVMMPTGEQWKARRYLISDVITPNFLHSVTAVQLHSSLSNLCGLWKEKMRLAQGRPFSVVNDIFNSGLEAIWASTFGLGGSVIATLPQIQLLSLLKAIPLPTGFDEPANVPVTPYPPEFAAIMTIVGTANETAKSLFPAMASWFISRTQPFKRALSIKEQIIADLISKTSTHFTTEKKPDLKVTCAMDAILRRELIVAEKQSREPNFYSRDVIDEVRRTYPFLRSFTN